MGFRKVEKLRHDIFTFCGVVGRGRTLQTTLLCPARIFLVREHMTNVDAAQIITHVDDKPVFIAPNVKHRTPLPEETCRGKILADCRGAAIALQPDNRQPGFQRAFSVGMGLPKLLEPLSRNNVHLSLFWTSCEEDDRVSRLLCQCIGYKRLPLRVNSFALAAPNAGRQARLAAGARDERTLAAVACTPMILIEAPSSAYHGGMLVVGIPNEKRRRPHALLHQTAS